MSQITIISADEFSNIIKQGKHPQIIDVREYPEYQRERIDSAKLVSLSEFDKHISTLDQSETVYILCQSGARSKSAQDKLLRAGFDAVVVDGGLEACKRTGMKIRTQNIATWSMERQVRFAAGTLILIGLTFSWAFHPNFIFLTAFVGAGLVFSAVTNTCGMALIIAKLPWNQKPK